MTLTLVITNVAKLENGDSTSLKLDRRGAMIGRSPSADWSLPDPDRFISSTHCEIDFRQGAYWLTDRSTNGTFVNRSESRLSEPYLIASGDTLTIGQYEIACALDGADTVAAPPPPAAEPQDPAQLGWAPAGSAVAEWPTAPQAATTASDDWGGGSAGSNAAVWSTPTPAATPASSWSSPVSTSAAQPSAADVWDDLAASNVVDWARGGFGAPPAERFPAQGGAPTDPFGLQTPVGAPVDAPVGRDPFGLSPAAAPAQPPVESASPGWGDPAPSTDWGVAVQTVSEAPAQTSVAASPPPLPLAPMGADGAAEWSAFLRACGVEPTDLKVQPQAALGAAGSLLRRLIAGLVVMLEARTRAKAQLGAQGTSLELNGNNPLKFARSPERALAQMLNPPERGFMSAEQAVEDAFKDLQAHQMATLAAMQSALGATLARFSPEAIRGRAETRGLLAEILPSAREAELWNVYEREFEGVARGSDEAFMDIFAKQFRLAYEKAAAEMKQRGRG